MTDEPMIARPRRIGLLAPRSNVTLETELPELFRRRASIAPERVTFDSDRMRMTSVTPEALAVMNAQGERCAAELTDADCDVLAYACLVAVMRPGREITSGPKSGCRRRSAARPRGHQRCRAHRRHPGRSAWSGLP
jgi:maleate isomerase